MIVLQFNSALHLHLHPLLLLSLCSDVFDPTGGGDDDNDDDDFKMPLQSPPKEYSTIVPFPRSPNLIGVSCRERQNPSEAAAATAAAAAE